MSETFGNTISSSEILSALIDDGQKIDEEMLSVYSSAMLEFPEVTLWELWLLSKDYTEVNCLKK